MFFICFASLLFNNLNSSRIGAQIASLGMKLLFEINCKISTNTKEIKLDCLIYTAH